MGEGLRSAGGCECCVHCCGVAILVAERRQGSGLGEWSFFAYTGLECSEVVCGDGCLMGSQGFTIQKVLNSPVEKLVQY